MTSIPPRPELIAATNELEELARQLFAIERTTTGRPSEKPTHELARSAAYWMITLRRLAITGPSAWAALDERFPADPSDDQSRPAYHADEGPAEMISEVDVISAFVFGDMVLEDLAYAELVRRGRVPSWVPGDRVPSMWPAFVSEVESMGGDAMLKDVRYLDLTLAHARDVLVAHRDPTLWYMPSFASWGEVKLSRVTLDAARRDRALVALQAVEARLAVRAGYGIASDYERLLDHLLALAPRLDKAARDGVREAYRLAGFESPDIGAMVTPTIRLIRQHAALIPTASPA